MLPVYDPKSFASVDLRKYHIKTIKDAIRFLEFTMSRMDEALFVLKKFNTQYATFQNVSQQLQKKLQEQQTTYGAGLHVDVSRSETGEIQTVDDKNDEVSAEREALLAEVRQAVADETLQPAENEDLGERIQAEFERYKAVKGKNRIFYYRKNEEGKTSMVSDKDVPNDIKELLLAKMTEEAE